MRCATCEHENPPGLKFCGECGARLALLCGECGASNVPTQKYCGECGQKLTHAASAEPIRPQAGAHTPSESSLPEGERRQLTVMFCDLVGSTALSEKLDPEELRSLLHECRTVCGKVIARYVGDGILTYFGWPKVHEEDAERALRAASTQRQVPVSTSR